MSVTICKTVCRDIEEADHGEVLSASSMEHLAGCRECHGFYDERQKLRQLVASLETVAAPPDFELRVRSRIANEKAGASPGLWFSNFTFGFPSFALATLILVIGGVFALKVWSGSTTNTVAVETPTSKPSATAEPDQRPPTYLEVKPDVGNGGLARTGDDTAAIVRGLQPKRRSPVRSEVASVKNGGRIVTREFSSTPAPVVKNEEAIASMGSSIFPIQTASQPLRLSLDYSGGISRTISVPALSFGSERVLTRGSSPLVKNSPKGAW